MKKVILMFLGMATLLIAKTQTIIYSENFATVNVGSNATGWEVSSNTNVANYTRPFLCTTADKGLQTPAVGKNAPSRFILPALTYDAANAVISIRFKIYVFDANLNCNTAKDFECPTFVSVMLVKSTYAGGVNSLPAAADIYAQQTYRIAIANGDNTIIFNAPVITNGDQYKIYFDFKTAEGENCSAGGTKFVFDDFVVSKFTCSGNCAPIANNDYFDASTQGFLNTVTGNVYGGFALWASASPAGYERKSLSIPPAVNDGLDYDANNTPLADMTFSLVSSPTIVNSTNCPVPAPTGTLTFNTNGTFTYVRTDNCVSRISFTYKITDPELLESNVATVYIDFPPQSPLPVTFVYFKAERKQNKVELRWQTESEIKNKGFMVQRNTGNGWKDRKFIPSQGANQRMASMHNYNYTDDNDFNGITQYRLAQVDMDGSINYSKIETVAGEKNSNSMMVYPNPSKSNVNIVMPANSNCHLVLIDGSGRKIREWEIKGRNQFTIANLKPGLYTLQQNDLNSNLRTSVKIVIQ